MPTSVRSVRKRIHTVVIIIIVYCHAYTAEVGPLKVINW